MLIKKNNYTSGLKDKDGKYKIFKNKIIRDDQTELENTNTTNNIIEATINCTNNSCTGFIRNENNGETSYYNILADPYTEDSGNLHLTPEDKKEIEINRDNTTAKDHIEDHIDTTGAYHISSPFIGGNKTDSKISICDLRFILIVMIVVIIITLRIQKVLKGRRNYLRDTIRNNI